MRSEETDFQSWKTWWRRHQSSKDFLDHWNWDSLKGNGRKFQILCLTHCPESSFFVYKWI